MAHRSDHSVDTDKITGKRIRSRDMPNNVLIEELDDAQLPIVTRKRAVEPLDERSVGRFHRADIGSISRELSHGGYGSEPGRNALKVSKAGSIRGSGRRYARNRLSGLMGSWRQPVLISK